MKKVSGVKGDVVRQAEESASRGKLTGSLLKQEPEGIEIFQVGMEE